MVDGVFDFSSFQQFSCFIGSLNNKMKNSENFIFKESRLRSLVKSFLYRILSTIGTGILTWLIIKDIKETILITIVVQVFLTILYYFYERLWNKINWAKKNQE